MYRLVLYTLPQTKFYRLIIITMTKMNWEYLTCERCWKTFYRDKSHIKKRYFCSPECLTESRNSKYKPWTQYAYLTIEWFVEWVKHFWWRVLRCRCCCWKEMNVPTGFRWTTKSCWCMKNKKHWMSLSKEYRAWKGMLKRCNDKNSKSYKNYWGRWIKVLYKDMDDFIKDIWPIPWPEYSVDRIDVNWNYEPWNCRWATDKEQANNKTTNVFYRIWEDTHTISEWSDIFSMKYSSTKSYLQKHWERIFKN